MSPFQAEQLFEPAPACTRIRLITALSLGGSAVSGVLILLFVPGARMLPFIATMAAAMPLYILFLWFLARLRHYSLSDSELRVRRLLYSPKFPLAGLVSVEAVAEPLKAARKIYGNDGLGAISGRFKNKEWGTFSVYLTDPARAVRLRWKDGRTIVISPDKTQVFLDLVKKRLG